MSRRWKIILAISLVANLFLVGAGLGVFVVGSRLIGERADLRRGGDNQRIAQAFQSLPPDRRQALQDIMRVQALSSASDLQAARQARQDAARLMAANPYDPAAVTAALTRAREAEGRARAGIDATLAMRLASLSPQERQMFSRLLIRGPGRGGGRGGHGGPEGHPPPAGGKGPPP
jgi:uncharacterized membrane protein